MCTLRSKSFNNLLHIHVSFGFLVAWMKNMINLMNLYWLDTLQLTQEKEKKLCGSVFYWVIQKNS